MSRGTGSCPSDSSALLSLWTPSPMPPKCPHANSPTSCPLGALSAGQRRMTNSQSWERTTSSVGKGYFLRVVL